MSVALRPVSSTVPEFELKEETDRSVHFLEHGFPSPLVRWHHHDDYELHLITASKGKVFVGDHVGSFGPGHLVLTGPRLPHNWISQTEPAEVVELRDLVIQFPIDLIQKMAKFAPELDSLLPLLERSRHGIEFRGVNPEWAVDAFRRVGDSNGPGRITRLLDLLHHLSVQKDYVLLSTLAIRSKADQASQEKIQQVTKYVSEHFTRDISLSDMADLVCMNDSAFSRFFARSTGNSFNRFVNRLRVNKACELLADTDSPITDICYETGFNNIANFNRRFRELKESTPSEYRRLSRLQLDAQVPKD